MYEALQQDVEKVRRSVEKLFLPGLPTALSLPTWVNQSGAGLEAIAELSHALYSILQRLSTHSDEPQKPVFLLTEEGDIQDSTGHALAPHTDVYQELYLTTELPLEIMPEVVSWFVLTGHTHKHLIFAAISTPTRQNMLRVELDFDSSVVELDRWWRDFVTP